MASGRRLPFLLCQRLRHLPALDASAARAEVQQPANRVRSRLFGHNSRPNVKANTLPSGSSKKSIPTPPPPPPPAARRVPIAHGSVSHAFIDTYEPLSERILLYHAPGHGSFFATSYLVGGFLLVGAYSYAELFLKDRPGQQTSWLLKSVSAFSTVCVAAFGTVFILGPRKMIKSIAIVSSKTSEKTVQHGPRILRFEIKRALPFLKPDVLETLPNRVSLDRDVPLAVHDLNFTNVPRNEAQLFTEKYFGPSKPDKGGVFSAVTSLNRSLLYAWPGIKRETRRMFLRDQMAYVEVAGNGHFKLDLQNCSMLDMGMPLHRIITSDTNARPSMMRWLGQIFKG